MDSSSYKFPKLKGSVNWDIWSIRASAVLTQKGYIEVMGLATGPPTQPATLDLKSTDPEQVKACQAYQALQREYQTYLANREIQSYQAASLIRLMLEDGPLLQTRNINDVYTLWVRLQALYEPTGFSSEFLLSRELFSTTLARCNGSIEAYLTKIRRLTDELAAKQLTIPNKVIAAYTLSNLGPEWENTVAIISQTYRSQNGDIDLIALFSQLADESRRRQAQIQPDEMAMTAQNRLQRPKCPHCKKGRHPPKKCWVKYPHLMPKEAKEPQKEPQKEAYIAEEEIALHSSISEDIGTWYLDSAATSHISAYKGLF
jgi:LTR polyprotein gag-polypeptide-like protein